jgi:putative transposase
VKQIVTAKLKLQTNSEQFRALRQTQLAYRDALNHVSHYAFEHGKLSNQIRLRDETYYQIRTRYGLPAQMATNVPRQVGATYKTLWTKVKQNQGSREKGQSKKRYKGLDKAPRYVSPTLIYNYQRDYSLKRNQQASLLTLKGRVIVPYMGYDKHVALMKEEARIGAAKLWYDKPRKQFYLLVSLEVDIDEPTPEKHTSVVGVDVGVRYLAVTATTREEQSFYSGKRLVPQANHYARLRKRLQQKGTRNAKRRAIVVSGRERRLKQDANHVVSKSIVTQHPHSLIGLEDLKDIRERMKRRKSRQASKKQRKANAAYARWSFAELHTMVAYKALVRGSMAIKVDANYTSKACPRCGHTCDANRPNKGLLFICQNCQYRLHADLVGARNIAMRTLLIRQDWVRTGTLSKCPDGSDAEAKAVRLARYAELRWSSDPSPWL